MKTSSQAERSCLVWPCKTTGRVKNHIFLGILVVQKSMFLKGKDQPDYKIRLTREPSKELELQTLTSLLPFLKE